jgi:acyl-coenzyme A synthetase/AMP-(fatty) acid ligase
MENYKDYYNSILLNLKKKNTFIRYFSKNYTYLDSLNYSLKVLGFLKEKKLKNKTILTFSNKSFEMYSSIYPILISGNIWVPLSINLPLEKIKNILNQTNPDLCIYDYNNIAILNFLKKKVTCIKFSKIKLHRNIKLSIPDEIINLDINSTAFIYFTSGSTGLPKGIEITHKNIIADVYEQKKHLYQNKTKNLVFGDYYDTAFSIFFDIFFPAIFFGSVISPSITKSDNFYLIDHYKKNKINNLVAVPSTFSRLKEVLTDLKEKISGSNLIITGEPFYLSMLDFLYKKTKFTNIFNCYGGTEMGNWVFFHRCFPHDVKKYKKFNLVPIGIPFSKVHAKIQKNELIVSGPMIAGGYLDKNLNKNKFILGKNNTFYTGDKITKIKSIYICKGRADKMIKINGYRIEIPDVEANFRKLSYVKDLIIFEKKEKEYKNHLVAIISLIEKKEEIQIRNDLKKYLSPYMIPRKICILKNLPKNSNGKLDRSGIVKNYK